MQQIEQQPQYSNNSIQAREEQNPLENSAHIWALNTNDDNLFNFLMIQQGKVFNKSTKLWELRTENKGFNDEGLLEIYKIMSSVANSSNSMGFTEKKEVKQIMLVTCKTLVKSMVMNKKKWELQDSARDCIFTDVENQMFLFLTKTIQGHTSKMHFGSNQGLTENITHNDSFDFANNSIMGGKR